MTSDVEKNEKKQYKFWIKCSLQAPRDLFPYLGIDDSIYKWLVSYSQPNPRGYYVHRILDEVLKIATAMIRWEEFLQDTSSLSPKNPNIIEEAVVGAILDEQNMWQRKLIEALTELILFTETNYQDIYRHYFMIYELQNIFNTINNWYQYYGCEFNNYLFQANELIQDIKQLEGSINTKDIWYQQAQIPDSALPIKSYKLTSSLSSKLKKAIPISMPHERLTLGISYDQYSRNSKHIHLRTSEKYLEGYSIKQIDSNFGIIGTTIISIIVRCQKLINKVPEGINKQLDEIVKTNDFPIKKLQALTEEIFETGDLVVTIYGELGQVISVSTSILGYKAYKIKYLVEKPLKIQEENFPGNYLKKLISKDLIKDVIKIAPEIGNMSIEKQHELLSSAIVNLWGNGLKEVVLQNEPEGYESFFISLCSQMNLEKNFPKK